MSRIQGLALEFLVAGAISSVKITVIVKYALPLIIQQGLFMIIMPFLLFFFGRRLFTHNWFENSIIVFGTACGVVATGFLLLRLIDPELKPNPLKLLRPADRSVLRLLQVVFLRV